MMMRRAKKMPKLRAAKERAVKSVRTRGRRGARGAAGPEGKPGVPPEVVSGLLADVGELRQIAELQFRRLARFQTQLDLLLGRPKRQN
jgi:hypothetical protein